MVEVESPRPDVLLREHLNERDVVDEQAFRQVASRRLLCALPASLSSLPLVARDPIVVFPAEVHEQAAAVQDCPAFPIEALTRAGTDGLDSVGPVFQAKCGTVSSPIDGSLNRRARLYCDRRRGAGVVENAGLRRRCGQQAQKRHQAGGRPPCARTGRTWRPGRAFHKRLSCTSRELIGPTMTYRHMTD